MEASEILKRELGDKYRGWTYEKIRSKNNTGYMSIYLLYSANFREFSSSAKVEVVLELAKIDLQKGSTIPELVGSCCHSFPQREALEKLIELGKQSEPVEKLIKSVLEFESRQGITCLMGLFQMAAHYRNDMTKISDYPSGPMMNEIEQSCAYLIDLAKCFHLDLGKILNHTAKNGSTLFYEASIYSETITRRLLEENVLVNSINPDFVTPFFRVRMNFFLRWNVL